MKTLDLAVIVDERNDLGKYYLLYLASIGYRVQTVYVLKQSVLRKLKVSLYKIKQKLKRILVSDKAESSTSKSDYDSAINYINSQFTICIDKTFKYENFASVVKKVSVGSQVINDDRVYDEISTSKEAYILFSGGGIVKPRLLNIPNKKLLHIHPGIVPDVKGADCLYWSILTRGIPGYSCFYMSPEIDEGDILYRADYPINEIDLPLFDERKLDAHYQAILDSLDLHLRARCLSDFILSISGNFEYNNATQQSSEEGRTYFFMAPELRRLALKTILSHVKYSIGS